MVKRLMNHWNLSNYQSIKYQIPTQKLIDSIIPTISPSKSATAIELKPSSRAKNSSNVLSSYKEICNAITSKWEIVYSPNRIDAADSIAIASMSMKKYHDDEYIPMFFYVGDFVMLLLHKDCTIPITKLITKKLQEIFVGPFKVTE
ncbi:hypothetical protein GcM1_207057 [Golovinomyces cichoracearum]|uniref:Uncharacterized protein n=1 Tax=Golovinomyces cichoracearum TaxID=62708 RepID=A0A420IWK8_9PEZI|nr:hypothetical protein GcM1_207057 [Golovinomyces cichoracearum]